MKENDEDINANTKKKERSFKEKLDIYHYYYKKTGLYKFLIRNTIKMILVLAALIAALLLAKEYLFDYDAFRAWIDSLYNPFVFSFFLASETILGWIPPDLFIIWAKKFDSPYLIVTILATLSYIGGMGSYLIGMGIRRIPKVRAFLEVKFEKHFTLIRKWGGVVVIIAALLPLPYSTISIVAGMVKYPFRLFWIFGITRYLRFYLYAIPLFSVSL